MFIVGLGAVFFGITIGWITYRIPRTRAGFPGLSDLTAILGVIGGAAVLALYGSNVVFGWYSVGLVIGFFVNFVVGVWFFGHQEALPWRQEQTPPASTPNTQSDTHED